MHGARELLWIERREGYIEQVLQRYPMRPQDCCDLTTFVSPNLAGVAADHNVRVFGTHTHRWYERASEPVVR